MLVLATSFRIIKDQDSAVTQSQDVPQICGKGKSKSTGNHIMLKFIRKRDVSSFSI